MVKFKFYAADDKSISPVKGKPITCRYCSFQFRIPKEEKLAWKSEQLQCPSCNQIYCVLPETEIKLKVLQDIFLENRTEEASTNLYILYKTYNRSLLLKHFTNIVNDPEDIEYHSHAATCKIFFNYYEKPEFKINTSFAEYAMYKLKESIFHKSEHETGSHSIHETDDDGKEKFVVGHYCKVNLETVKNTEATDFIRDIYETLIKDIYSHKEIEFKLLLALNNFLKNGEKGYTKFFQVSGIEGKSRFIRLINRLKTKIVQSAKT